MNTEALAAAWTPARNVRAGDVILWEGRRCLVKGKRRGTLDASADRALRAVARVDPADVFTLYLTGQALLAPGRSLLPVVGVARPPA